MDVSCPSIEFVNDSLLDYCPENSMCVDKGVGTFDCQEKCSSYTSISVEKITVGFYINTSTTALMLFQAA